MGCLDLTELCHIGALATPNNGFCSNLGRSIITFVDLFTCCVDKKVSGIFVFLMVHV